MYLFSFRLALLIVSSLIFVIESQSFNSTFNPDVQMRNCSLNETCSDSINSTTIHYFAIEYLFDPTKAVRVVTTMNYKVEQDPQILVVVRQARGVSSWTLPYRFPNGMLYSSVARILCLHNELNRTKIHWTTVFIEISTSDIESIDYSIRLENIGEYSIQTDQEQDFQISPTMPVFFRYTFPADSPMVFIDVKSKDDLCAVVSLQLFDCPVYDVNEIGNRQGHFQTMSQRASFNVDSDEFLNRNEFLLVFAVKPTDVECLDYQKRVPIQPAGFIDIIRVKNATVTLSHPKYYNYLYLTIFATLAVFFLVYLTAFGVMMKRKDIYDLFTPEQTQTTEPPNARELSGEFLRERTERNELRFSERPSTSRTSFTADDEENIIPASERSRPPLQSTISMVEVIPTSNNGFVALQELCLKNYQYLKEKFRIYPQTMLTIAIFYSLPVIQLVLQYQVNIESSGNEDLCYFNFLCTRQFAKLTAFNNVFSNIGYCALGFLFFIIVYRRDCAYTRYIGKYSNHEKSHGIPQHFGLYYAMAIGLIMEGVMSACYHVCPSKQNFQFDTSFMFIIAVLNVIKIYQKRHPDINPRSAGAFSFLAFLIFVNVIGVYYDNQWFWITYAVVHILICFIFMGKVYYMGRLKISYRVFIHLYRLMKKNGFFTRPLYLSRMWLLLAAGSLNISFALYGAIYQPESFPNHLLFVLLGNLALYLSYYILMKVIHREKFRLSSVIYLVAAIAFWAASLNFFYQEVKSYEVQPAISRTRNQPCVLLNTYDVHDVWHLLSSFGLFFSFMTLLTIDDGVRNELRTKLAAF